MFLEKSWKKGDMRGRFGCQIPRLENVIKKMSRTVRDHFFITFLASESDTQTGHAFCMLFAMEEPTATSQTIALPRAREAGSTSVYEERAVHIEDDRVLV